MSSIVQQTSFAGALREHRQRISNLENSDGSGPWVFVGGSDPLSPPFLNGWGNTGAPQADVSFKRFLNWVHLRGGFIGGALNTIVFVLPEFFRPAALTPMLVPVGDASGFSTVTVDVDGSVTFIR